MNRRSEDWQYSNTKWKHTMIYVHVHMWRQVSLFWEAHMKLSLSDQERVLILESMKNSETVVPGKRWDCGYGFGWGNGCGFVRSNITSYLF